MNLSSLIETLKKFHENESPHDEVDIIFTNEEGYKINLESINAIERLNVDYAQEFDDTSYCIEFNIGVKEPGR